MEIGPIVRALARNKVRFGLIVVQIAITLAVVANAVNMILVERAKMLRPSAFDEHNILSVISERFAATFNDPNYSIAVVESDLRLLRAIPGVVAVTNTQFIPWEGVGGNRSNTFILANRDFSSQYYDVTPGFLDVLGMRIVEGRDLRPTDIDDNPNASAGPVLISRDLERYLFGNGSAVGRLIKDHEGGMWTVVGVCARAPQADRHALRARCNKNGGDPLLPSGELVDHELRNRPRRDTRLRAELRPAQSHRRNEARLALRRCRRAAPLGARHHRHADAGGARGRRAAGDRHANGMTVQPMPSPWSSKAYAGTVLIV